MANLKELTYMVETNTKGLNRAVPALEKLTKTLEQLNTTLSAMGSNFTKQMTTTSKAAQGQAKTTSDSADKVAQALMRQEAAIIRARDSMASLNQSVIHSGATGELVRDNADAFDAYQRELTQTVKTSAELSLRNAQYASSLNATKRELKDQVAAQREAIATQKRIESSLLRQENAVEKARIKYLDLRAAIDRSVGPEGRQKIEELDAVFGQFEGRMKSGVLNAQQFSRAQNRLASQMADLRRNVISTRLERFNLRMQELTKSVQIALGPLSGIAARITAFTGLLNQSNVMLAIGAAAVIAFGTAMVKSIMSASSLQRQLLGLEAAVAATGNAAGISAEEIDSLARKIARTTMTTQTGIRSAVQALLAVEDLPGRFYEQALLAAQGLSLVARGDIESQIKPFTRFLSDPMNNLQALTESGVHFNEVEKERIRILQRSGEIDQARMIGFERLNAIMALASKETGGLSGAWNRLKESMTDLAQTFGSVFLPSLTALTEAATVSIDLLTKGLSLLGRSFSQLKAMAKGLVTETIDPISNAIAKADNEFDMFESELSKQAREVKRAQASLVFFRDEFLKMNKETIEGENNLARFNKMVKVLGDDIEETAKQLNISVQELERMRFAVNNLGTPLDKLRNKWRDNIKVSQEDLLIARAQGRAKGELMRQQEVLNTLVSEGIIETRDMSQVQDFLSSKFREGATEIMGLVRAQADYNEMIEQTLDVVKSLDEIEVLQREASMINASNRERRVAIAVLQKQHEFLNKGMVATEEQLGLVAKRINLEMQINQLMNNRKLAEEASLLQMEVKLAEATTFHRNNIIDRRKDELEIIREMGSLETDASQTELKLREQIRNLKLDASHAEEQRSLVRQITLQQKHLQTLFFTQRVRETLNARAEKELELADKYGSLLDERAQKELRLFDQILKTNEFIDQINSLANVVEQQFSRMADAITDFAMTGKADIKGLIDSAIRDFIRFANNEFVFNVLRNLMGAGISRMFPTQPPATFGNAVDMTAITGTPVSVMHSGGIVGQTSTPKFTLPVFHNGFKPNEFLALLETGEEVISNEERRRGVGSGAPEINIEINIEEPEGFTARQTTSQTPSGQRVDITFDQVTSGLLRNPNSRLSRVLNERGAAPKIVRRG